MSQTSRRKLRWAFGAAVLAAFGFGVTQVTAEPRASEESRFACPSFAPYVCQCEVPYCSSQYPCPPCL